MLTVENLEVSYGDVRALDGVSLEVVEGAIIAIVGANGAGKTTLIRTIAGMLRPARGRIRLRGNDIVGLPSHRVCNLGIGQVAEGRQVFPTLTTLHSPIRAIGSLAAQKLFAGAADGKMPVPDSAPVPQLVVRESTGPVRSP